MFRRGTDASSIQLELMKFNDFAANPGTDNNDNCGPFNTGTGTDMVPFWWLLLWLLLLLEGTMDWWWLFSFDTNEDNYNAEEYMFE